MFAVPNAAAALPSALWAPQENTCRGGRGRGAAGPAGGERFLCHHPTPRKGTSFSGFPRPSPTSGFRGGGCLTGVLPQRTPLPRETGSSQGASLGMSLGTPQCVHRRVRSTDLVTAELWPLRHLIVRSPLLCPCGSSSDRQEVKAGFSGRGFCGHHPLSLHDRPVSVQ